MVESIMPSAALCVSFPSLNDLAPCNRESDAHYLLAIDG